jgi:hypothetical protein
MAGRPDVLGCFSGDSRDIRRRATFCSRMPGMAMTGEAITGKI